VEALRQRDRAKENSAGCLCGETVGALALRRRARKMQPGGRRAREGRDRARTPWSAPKMLRAALVVAGALLAWWHAADLRSQEEPTDADAAVQELESIEKFGQESLARISTISSPDEKTAVADEVMSDMLIMLESLDPRRLEGRNRKIYSSLLGTAQKAVGRTSRRTALELPGQLSSLAIPLLLSVYREGWEGVEHLSVR
jgi:hypothetical protein